MKMLCKLIAGCAAYRSAIGIYEGHSYSTGVRITTPILRFYMNNSHIG